jgi:Uma2 family endonuclease
MTATQTTLARLAETNPEGHWELVEGVVREKPEMSFTHNEVMFELGFQLRSQLSPQDYVIRANIGRIRLTNDTYFIPDVFVAFRREFDKSSAPESLEVYEAPLPLVVEVWSPSTGAYDIDAKIPLYQERKVAEIWRIHPYDRVLRHWRLQSDGTYEQTEVRGGVVELAALTNVRIDLGALFARR